MTTPTDFLVIHYGDGNVVLLRGENEAARDHLEDNTNGVWISNCLAVDLRFLPGLIAGLEENGFSVSHAR